VHRAGDRTGQNQPHEDRRNLDNQEKRREECENPEDYLSQVGPLRAELERVSGNGVIEAHRRETELHEHQLCLPFARRVEASRLQKSQPGKGEGSSSVVGRGRRHFSLRIHDEKRARLRRVRHAGHQLIDMEPHRNRGPVEHRSERRGHEYG